MGRQGRRRKQLLANLTKRIIDEMERKHYIALCEELALEEAMGLS